MYQRTFEELEQAGSKFWPSELNDIEAGLSTIPLLLRTQEQFIAILCVETPCLDSLFKVIEASSLGANVFLKHLVILADFGGEMLQRVSNEFGKLFTDGKLHYTWRGSERVYTFEALPDRAFSNASLKIGGNQLNIDHPIDGIKRDAIALLMFGSAYSGEDEQVASTLAKCEIGDYLGKPVTIRAGAESVRVIHEGREIACQQRSYARGKRISQSEHKLQALQRRQRNRGHHLEETFDALGEVAREFHLKLQTRPIKTTRHLRRLLNLVRLYGRSEVLAAIARAHQYQTYDAAYVETILLQERRRRELPSPTPLRPQRQELIDEIDIEDPDPAIYDRLLGTDEQEQEEDDQT